VASLEDVLRSKEEVGRDKDIRAALVIRTYLRGQRRQGTTWRREPPGRLCHEIDVPCQIRVRHGTAHRQQRSELHIFGRTALGGGGNRTGRARSAKAHVSAVISTLPAMSVGRNGTHWDPLALAGTHCLLREVSNLCPATEPHCVGCETVANETTTGAPGSMGAGKSETDHPASGDAVRRARSTSGDLACLADAAVTPGYDPHGAANQRGPIQ